MEVGDTEVHLKVLSETPLGEHEVGSSSTLK
jgi:hypothetical protein